ncbi:MAG: DUF6034 family protein [Oscillospiraceae bacterium]|nr:DUF6034 family protein [Oscillospiraceae bacterium]
MNNIKKRIIHYLLAVTLALSACGCAETPDRDNVASKNDNTDSAQVESGLEGVLGNINTENCAAYFFNENKTIGFEISNDIALVDSDGCATIKIVRPHSLLPDEIKSIVLASLGEVPLYEYSEVRTKEQLEALILEKQHAALFSEEDIQALVNCGECRTYEEAKTRIEKYQDFLAGQIEALKADYALAPEQKATILSDFFFFFDSYYSSENSNEYTMFASADWLDSVKMTTTRDHIPYFIWCAKCEAPEHLVSTFYLYPHVQDSLTSEWSYYQTTPFSETEKDNAVSLAESFLSDINLGEWVIQQIGYQEYKPEGSGSATYAMIMDCTPVYNGIPVTDAKGSYTYSESYRPTCTATDMQIYVSNGKIMTIMLDTPLEIVKESNPPDGIMSFEKALPYIQNQLTNKYTLGYLTDTINGGQIRVHSAEVHISQTRLEYVRTYVKDSESEFYLIPAWVLYGYILENEATMVSGEPPKEALLIINATDGSVIDLAQGY